MSRIVRARAAAARDVQLYVLSNTVQYRVRRIHLALQPTYYHPLSPWPTGLAYKLHSVDARRVVRQYREVSYRRRN